MCLCNKLTRPQRPPSKSNCLPNGGNRLARAFSSIFSRSFKNRGRKHRKAAKAGYTRDKGVENKHGIHAKTIVTPEVQQRNQEKHTYSWSTGQGGNTLCKRWKRNQLKTTILTMMNHNIKSDQILLTSPKKVQQSGVQLTQEFNPEV